ncbi:MAG: molybdopterin-dependent oxidoreductase [Chloroflexi bacterium]|nr:molybdopterin-dependent oxidoreductase [Chloroflexota bacterium]
MAIAIGELAAGLLTGAPSLVIAIGDLIIDLQPPGAKDLMVDLFGDNDKLALVGLIVAAALAIAARAGISGRNSWPKAIIAFVVAGGVALFAATRQPLVDPVLAVVTVALAVAASLVVLRWLLELTRPGWSVATSPESVAEDRAAKPRGVATMPDWQRRRFLLRSGSIAAGAIAVAAVGRGLLERGPSGSTAGSGVGATLAPAASPVPSLVADVSFDGIAGLTPIVVPNDDFYRIDTALIVPRVNADTWKLKVTGMVDREVSLSYADLQAMPQFEQYVTIACVSNKVGEDLVGNAKWSGVRLREVLAMAGVKPGATQLVGRSVDRFTAGFPTAWAMDPTRDPMIALGMNSVPLPMDHGFPARLIIPGLFGYVSATKWLSEIELTTLEAFDGYWVPLGWAKEAPILTQSRIDVPRRGQRMAAGQAVLAGVAWAPDRGVTKVEVRIDDGAWQPARISTPMSAATWVQWRFDWAATEGRHTIAVRATDGTGEVQTDRMTPPAPDGARGHHTIEVQVG